MLSKVRVELDDALKKAQTSAAAEMTAKEELKEQAFLAKEVGRIALLERVFHVRCQTKQRVIEYATRRGT